MAVRNRRGAARILTPSMLLCQLQTPATKCEPAKSKWPSPSHSSNTHARSRQSGAGARGCNEERIQRPSAVAAKRASTRLNWQIAGGLDQIVLMAMRKEPEWRYQSAGQFAEDIHDYLEQNRVRVGANILRYRVGKFLGRHTTLAFVMIASSCFRWGKTTQLDRRLQAVSCLYQRDLRRFWREAHPSSHPENV